jgi:hypothetical protein
MYASSMQVLFAQAPTVSSIGSSSNKAGAMAEKQAGMRPHAINIRQASGICPHTGLVMQVQLQLFLHISLHRATMVGIHPNQPLEVPAVDISLTLLRLNSLHDVSCPSCRFRFG